MHDLDAIRRRLADPVRVVRLLGLERGAQRQPRGVVIACPVHNEKTPSCSVRLAGDGTIACHCFGCGWSGDVIDLIAAVHGIEAKSREAIRAAAELAGVEAMPLFEAQAKERQGLRSDLVEKIPPSDRVQKRKARDDAAKSAGVNPPTYPPTDQLEAVWSGARPVWADDDAAAYLTSRGIDVDAVADRELCRVLELNAQLPSWARFRRRSWALTGHRIVTPLYDATGNMRSLRAWRWAGGDTPKRLAPAGFTCAGLVMADALGLLLLQAGERPAWWPPHVPLVAVVVEGEPDYLTRATLASDADETAPAVFGLVSGSWSDEVAERIPTDTVVTLRTDTDLAGATYAHVVARSLASRCPVRRLTA